MSHLFFFPTSRPSFTHQPASQPASQAAAAGSCFIFFCCAVNAAAKNEAKRGKSLLTSSRVTFLGRRNEHCDSSCYTFSVPPATPEFASVGKASFSLWAPLSILTATEFSVGAKGTPISFNFLFMIPYKVGCLAHFTDEKTEVQSLVLFHSTAPSKYSHSWYTSCSWLSPAAPFNQRLLILFLQG